METMNATARNLHGGFWLRGGLHTPKPKTAMQISRCGIHGFHEVLGIDTDEIRLLSTRPESQTSLEISGLSDSSSAASVVTTMR
jgi:hypothetical protein